MSNNWYTKTTDVVPYTRAKDTDIDTPLEQIELAFDKLPEPHDSKPGFKTVPISDAENLDEAVSAQQVLKGELTYAVDSGVADAYVITLPIAPLSYYSGLVLWFKASNANTGACTINVNGLGIKSLKNYQGADLIAGDISAGQNVGIAWNGTYFQVVSDLPGYARSAEQSALDAAASAVESAGYAADAQAVVDVHNAVTGIGVHGLGTASTATVVTSATDTTADRVLTVGAYGAGTDAGTALYGRANAVGTVSHSGGTPTGALFEYGLNANGEYLKLADGRLLCWIYAPTTPDSIVWPATPVGEIRITTGYMADFPRMLCVSNITTTGADVTAYRYDGSASNTRFHIEMASRWQ